MNDKLQVAVATLEKLSIVKRPANDPVRPEFYADTAKLLETLGGLLADEAVWHINAGRIDNAEGIFRRCEEAGIMLPPSRLTCMALGVVMQHRRRMGVDV